MKRFALLVGALAISASAVAAEDVEFKNSGEFRLRYQNDLNPNGNDSSGQNAETDSRFKLNMGVRKGEKVQAFISLIHGASLGGATTNGPTGGAVTGDATNGKYQTADAQNVLLVNRAWGWWKASDSVSLKVGRFGIEIADGSVFAENDWEAVPTAHEGAQVAWDTNFAKLNFFAIKTAQFAPAAGNNDPERNLYMVSADLKNMPESIKMANIHLIQVNGDAHGAETAGLGAQNWQHIGLTVGGDTHSWLYKFTGAYQFGSFDKSNVGGSPEQKLNANMFDVMVGYQMPETMGLKISLGYHMDSGDDTTTNDKQEGYQTLFYDMHNNAGLMNVVRWGNLSYADLIATIQPADDLSVGLGYYMFTRSSSDNKSPATFATAYNFNTANLGTDKNIGSEIDLWADKAYEGGVKIGARLGAFMPGSYLSGGTDQHSKTIMDAFLQASVGF